IITTRKLKKEFSLEHLLREDFPDLFIITHSLELLQKIPLRENIFAELISTRYEQKKTRSLYEFCISNGVKYVASNPIYFLNKDDYLIHQTVTAIRTGTTIENINSADLADEEFYFKDPAQIEKIWRKLPDALNNIEFIKDDCNVDLGLGRYKFPVYPSDEDPFSLLWQLSFEGLSKRYNPVTPQAKERLLYELNVINDLHLSNYFLVVWDILKEARRRGMITIGRGSAANSIVSYCLGFT